MSENSESIEEGQTSGASPKNKKSKLLIVIVVLLALGAGAAGSYFYLQSASAKTKTETSKKASDEDEDEDEPDDEASDESDEVKEKESKESKDGQESKDGKESTRKSSLSKLMLPKDKDVKQVIEIQPFILNLADKEDNRFLRLSLSLGIGEEGGEKPDEVFLARIRNAILAVLMTKTSAEILTPEGKATLRKEILQAARKVTEEPHIIAVYITELIVQR